MQMEMSPSRLDDSGRVRTIQQLELLHYGNALNSAFLNKADSDIGTGTNNYLNSIYGALAWAQINLEANPVALLPKFLYRRSGYRMITDRITMGTANGNSSLGGTPEGGQIAETRFPAVGIVEIIPKIAQMVFGSSTVQEWLSRNSNDDTLGMSNIKEFMAVQHKENLSRMLMIDAEAAASGASGNYAGSTNWESLDRIISSDSEEDALGGAHADWYDPWDKLDRDDSDTYDAVVRSASGTIGTNGPLTQSNTRRFFRDVLKSGGKYGDVVLTSHDVVAEIQEIFDTQVRYRLGEKVVELDVNGVRTFSGHNVGLQVAALYGVPIIGTKDSSRNANDADEVGRMFMLDTSDPESFGQPRLGIGIARPTTYREIGSGTPYYPFYTNRFNERGLYYTFGETICVRYNGQGKLRDIEI